MSDKTLMTEIKKNVEQINESTKSFGPKLPSHPDKIEENGAQSLSYEQMIMGTLASLTFGENNKDTSSKVKTLIGGSKNNLYQIVKEIKQKVINDSNNISKIYSELVEYNRNLLDRLFQGDQTLISVEKILEHTENTINANNTVLKSLKEYLDTTTSSEKVLQDTIKNLRETHEETVKIALTFDNVEQAKIDSLTNLFNELEKNPNIKFDDIIHKLNEFFISLSNINTIDSRKINNNINTLANIISDDKKGFKSIINVLSDILENNEFKGNIEGLGKSLDGLIAVVSFDPAKLDNKGVKKLAKFLDRNSGYIGIIIDNLNELVQHGANEKNEALESINTFLDILIKIGSIDKDSRKTLKSNILFFDTFIQDVLGDEGFIIRIVQRLNEIKNPALEAISELSDVIDSIISIGDKSIKDIIKLGVNLYLFEDIINSYIIGDAKKGTGIISALISVDGRKLRAAIEKAETIHKLISIISSIFESLPDFKLIMGSYIKIILLNFFSNVFAKFVENTNDIIEQLKSINLSEDKFKEINNIFNVLDMLANIKISIAKVKIGQLGLSMLGKSVEKINAIVEKFKDINDEDLKKTITTLDSFNKIVIMAAGILLVGGIVMGLIDIASLASFTICLGGFIWGMTEVLNSVKETLSDSLDTLEDFTRLVAISAGILLIGGFMMHVINVEDIFSFAFILGVFIWGVTLAYVTASEYIENEISSAKDFATLIGISGLTLLTGALLMKFIDPLSIIGFVVLLTAFIFGITWAYALGTKGIDKQISNAKDFGILVAISALTLMIGGLFLTNMKRFFQVLGFAVLLALFIAGISFAIKLLPKNINKAVMSMLALSVLIAISAATLLISGLLLMKYPDLPKNIFIFGVIIIGFIAIMGLIAWGLTTLDKFIKKGIISMMLICAILVGFTVAMYLVVGLTALMKSVGYMEILKTLGIMALTVVILGVICGIIGIPAVAACVGLGIVVMFGMAILLIAMSVAFMALTLSIKYANTLDSKQVENAMGIMGTAVWELVTNLGPKLAALSLELPFILGGIAAVLLISVSLSALAHTIQLWANLRIPEYDANGKPTGKFSKLGKSDFEQVADNVEVVVTTLADAVASAYNDHKDLFEADWLGFGESPISKVINSFKHVGPMLASIAKGIKEWVNLRIPAEYNPDGSVKSYQTLISTDFTRAANNIREVLTAIGGAIVDTVKGNTEVFGGDDWFKNSPAIVAAKAMKIMGEVLNNTAMAVGAYASRSFPVYDENGKLLPREKWITVEDKDLKQAGENIKLILTSLGQAIKDTVQGSPIFKTNEAQNAADAINKMASGLNNIVDTISKLSELKIDDITKELDPMGTNNIYTKLRDLIKFTGALFILFTDPSRAWGDNGNEKQLSVDLAWYKGGGTKHVGLAEYITHYNEDIEDANKALKTFTGLFTDLIANYGRIGKLFTDNRNNLKVYIGGSKSPIYTYVATILFTIKRIIERLSSKSNLELYELIDNNEQTLNKGIGKILSVISTLMNALADIKNKSGDVKDFSLKSIVELISDFNTLIYYINNIGKNYKELESSINKPFSLSQFFKGSEDIKSAFELYISVIEKLVKLSEQASKDAKEGFNVLRDGMISIYSTISSQNNIEFKNHIDELKRYIETINSVKLSNLSQLKGFVDSLNALSAHLGNLDNLTDALSNKLSAVLYELVLQLRKAEATISNAHQLQEKRKKLMEESIDKIRTIMGEPMVVEITQKNNDSPNKSTDTPGGASNIDYDDGKARGTDETSSNTTLSPYIASPEAEGDKGQEKNANGKSSKLIESMEALTFEQFKRYMEDNIINKFST